MYEEDNSTRNTILAVGGVLLVVALVAIFFLKASKPAPVKPPAALVPYTASDKSFAGTLPDGWARQGTGGMGIMSGVTASRQSASIAVLSDLQGSLMGDMARATSVPIQSTDDRAPTINLPPPKPPVEQLHAVDRGRASAGLESYDEDSMHEFTSPLGDARVSEWTGTEKGPLGLGTVKVHGYRATILGGDRRVTVVCRCNDSDWVALRPMFQNVMASLKPGGG